MSLFPQNLRTVVPLPRAPRLLLRSPLFLKLLFSSRCCCFSPTAFKRFSLWFSFLKFDYTLILVSDSLGFLCEHHAAFWVSAYTSNSKFEEFPATFSLSRVPGLLASSSLEYLPPAQISYYSAPGPRGSICLHFPSLRVLCEYKWIISIVLSLSQPPCSACSPFLCSTYPRISSFYTLLRSPVSYRLC